MQGHVLEMFKVVKKQRKGMSMLRGSPTGNRSVYCLWGRLFFGHVEIARLISWFVSFDIPSALSTNFAAYLRPLGISVAETYVHYSESESSLRSTVRFPCPCPCCCALPAIVSSPKTLLAAINLLGKVLDISFLCLSS